MLVFEIIRVGLNALFSNRLRSLLTMLGVIIGVAAVIAVVAMGEGAKRAVNERIQALGTNLLIVTPGRHMWRGAQVDEKELTPEDAAALAASDGLIAAVAPELTRSAQVQFEHTNITTQIVGTTPEYLLVRRYEIAAGRFFGQSEVEGRRRVVVLTHKAAQDLFRDHYPVGEKIRIRGITFEVIGVLADKGVSGAFTEDDHVVVPVSTAQFRVFGIDRLRLIAVEALDAESLPMAMAEIERVLRRQHRIPPGQDNDFFIRDQATILTAFQETNRTFSLLLAGIAAVSLLVGGIGIMNIMLVSVTERTREIGVRKALGATRGAILFQFLVEALVLSLFGGVIGILVGIGAADALSRFARWNTAVAPQAILLAFFFASAVGITFGLYPARRASRLDPIEALRYE